MRTFKTEGIILKRRNTGEADRILTILSKNYGKLQIKAKGVRKITSRRAQHIELVNLATLAIYKSNRTFLPILTEARALESFPAIKDNLRKIGLAYYICELLDAFCPLNQENRQIFFLAYNTFKRLATEEDYKAIIGNFEKELLNTLGFWSKYKPLTIDSQSLIENILERKLYAKRLLRFL